MHTGKESLDPAPGPTRAGDAFASGCRIKPLSFAELRDIVPIQLAD